MSEGGYKPEGLDIFELRKPHVEKEPVRSLEVEHPAEDLTDEELQESQRSYAIGRGYSRWEEIRPIEQAEFWALEGGVSDNHIQAEQAAQSASLDRTGQLGIMTKAVESRMHALAFDSRRSKVDEFHRADRIGQRLKAELTRLA